MIINCKMSKYVHFYTLQIKNPSSLMTYAAHVVKSSAPCCIVSYCHLMMETEPVPKIYFMNTSKTMYYCQYMVCASLIFSR